MSAKAYRLMKFYQRFLPPGQNFVEIGSERGGGSTKYLYDLCMELGHRFSTVDIDPQIHQRAREIAPGSAVLQDGTQFLESFDGRIGFAYLDNFDWDWGGMGEVLDRQVRRYRELDMELSNENSQAAHLAQAQAIESRAADTCFVLIDDTFWDDELEQWSGKGGAATPYLESKHFKILDSGRRFHRNKPFVLLGRGRLLTRSPRWRLWYPIYRLVLSRVYMDDVEGLSMWIKQRSPRFVHAALKKLYRSRVNRLGADSDEPTKGS